MQELLYIPNPDPNPNHALPNSWKREVDTWSAEVNSRLAAGCRVIHAVPAGCYTLLIIEHP